ncbi:hypothetical protein HGRIS_009220 [Hohenbuehelia grisea]|uniref:ABC transmembrane type-1 domain-containing protein n=1 Tax=Hohenbuehelia grisea TaxID=104357 RepID=A0ABR3J0W7_9AGAR
MRLPVSLPFAFCIKAWYMPSSDIFSLSSCARAPHKDAAKPPPKHDPDRVFRDWMASRSVPSKPEARLHPGAQRPLSPANSHLAYKIASECSSDLFYALWSLHPLRTTVMMSLNIFQSFLPAFRGYSQAMLLDELQSLVSSGHFTWIRISQLLLVELVRRILEGMLDSFASSNEMIVLNSAKFYMERKQLEQRVRLDLPTISDPVIRDLLQESDLFVRSFHGSSGFGLVSPLEIFRVLSLATEISSHLLLIYSLTRCSTHVCVLVFSTFPAMLPLLMAWFSSAPVQADPWAFTPSEAQAAERQEKLRNLAYSDAYRPEVHLFGLGKWILESWTTSRKVVLEADRNSPTHSASLTSSLNLSEFLTSLQHIPLILMLQSSSVSLGSLTLYRSSIQSVVFATRSLLSVVRMAFQSIFLMGAFTAAMQIKPLLEPKREESVPYPSIRGGMKLEARGLCFAYPGSSEPALRDVNFTLEAGETLAIVGHNGSGTSLPRKL